MIHVMINEFVDTTRAPYVIVYRALCGYQSEDKTEFRDSSGLVISPNKSNRNVTCDKCLEKLNGVT